MLQSVTETIGKWFDTCHRAGVPLLAATEMADELAAAYGESHRHYHTLSHVETCLRMIDNTSLESADRVVTEFALWFHDMVFDTRSDDNEERSAAVAEEWLRAQEFDQWHRVGGAVRMTASHELGGAEDAATRVVHDVDLAILGAGAAEYDRYRAQVRAEYAWVDDAVFASGRRRVLEDFASLDPIFVVPGFRAAFEASARANIERELAELG